MAQDYSKLKNDELQNLLKQRGLPHTGKKADMVSRLQEDDSKPTSTDAPAAAAREDEIDWDDDAGETATTKDAEAAIAAGGQGRVNNPTEVPNQVVAEDPATTDDLTAVPPTEGASATNGSAAPADATTIEQQVEEKPAVDFTRGLAMASMEEELTKRAARAKKFGIPDNEAEESLKLLERSKKFGETTEGPKGLNEALPERPLGKRRREGGDEGGRGGFKRRGGRGAARGRGRRGTPGAGSRREDRPVPVKGGDGTWMTDKDRAAAEARKNKFAAPAATS